MISLFGISFGTEYFIALGVIAVAAFLLYNRGLLRGKKHLSLIILRSAAIFMLFLVLAGPFQIREESVMKKSTSLYLVNDFSGSMDVRSRPDLLQVKNAIGKSEEISEVRLINASERNRTALGDLIYREILSSGVENNIVVIASDGNNNHGANLLDVAAFAAETNTRIFPVIQKSVASEIFIKGIDGSNKIPAGSEYELNVVVGSFDENGASARYQMEIAVDGAIVFEGPSVQDPGERMYEVRHTFENEGDHQIVARIIPESQDSFFENNVFYKSVKVIKRPVVLFIYPNSNSSGRASPLGQVLSKTYDVDFQTSTAAEKLDFSSYGAIVIDDVPARDLDAGKLREFLNEGGGIMVVGGKNSYGLGDYYGNQFESLLPVKSKEGERASDKETNVVILIDVSGSTGIRMGANSKIDVEKAIAVNIIQDLSAKANIGLAAFNSQATRLRSVSELNDPGPIKETIERLRFVGGTYVSEGLKEARDMLEGKRGGKYVILISDGVTEQGVAAFEEASRLAAEGIIIHSVGVGFDTDSGFMKGVAERTGGAYFAPSESERIELVLGLLEEDEEREGIYIVIVNNHHFITEELDIKNVSIAGFNEVMAKPGSQVLATTAGAKPLLTVWRFGLGRVISLAVDDGRQWAGALYTKDNSRIIASSVSWAIGDPERGKDTVVECTDTHIGEEATIVVDCAGSRPNIAVDGVGMSLIKLDSSTYYMTFAPARNGFVRVGSNNYSCEIAVNYAQEYQEFATNREALSNIAKISGGKVYSQDGLGTLAEEISGFVDEVSKGTATKRQNMQIWFSLIALLLFFADVVMRRVQDIRSGAAGPVDWKADERSGAKKKKV